MTLDSDELAARLSPYISSLPVGEVASEINRSLRETPRLVVTAAPGAGKSTLLPLTILSDTPEGKIILLEPRRIAARQIAGRMAAMIGEVSGLTVGYRMRFEQKVSGRTRIEVVTEGIFERMLIDDPLLEGVSTVIFDEFHERSLTSDLSLALTREIQNVIRPDLRLVIMSATIDADSVCSSFDAPCVTSEGSMFDVAVEYCGDIDPADCASAAASAVRRALRENDGDILVFLPGQGEIMRCAELLAPLVSSGLRIYPLYGLLSQDEQRNAILPSPQGTRKVVLATPIAETSLTIEGVRTVIDSGLCRVMKFDPHTGLSRLETSRISLDMARQRTGRAGRLCAGRCYRLWSKTSAHLMRDSRAPEVIDADLSPVVLAIAAWGESDAGRLPWITPPPAGHLSEAVRLLTLLGALDDKGNITARGRRMASLPCHPRMAVMLLAADAPELRALAADIAALLEEKDPLADDSDADINTRIQALRQRRAHNRGGRWERIIRIAAQYRRMTGAPEDNSTADPADVGRLVATAYPERVAMLVGHNSYKLAGGGLVSLSDDDDLSRYTLLAVASMDRRIFLASPVEAESLGSLARWRDVVTWDSRQGRAVACRQLRLGSLVLGTRPVDGDYRELIVSAICEAAPKDGLSMFDFNDDTVRMQQRLATVAEWHPELDLPDLSTEALLASAAEWLPMYIGKATTAQELKKIDMCSVMWGCLDYERQQAVDRIAPSRLTLPCGRSVRIDYRPGATAPVVSARLQDCFGLTDTPRLDDGKRPVLMELLSPGFKPVQLTSDLRGFWQNTYFEVRKELRRRYPKHRWPDNPDEAAGI